MLFFSRSCICYTIILIPILAYVALKIIYNPPNGTINIGSPYGYAQIIYESSYGVPYITGVTNEAASYALGFAHAADRLYDLQLRRAFAAGRLAEVIIPLSLLAIYFRGIISSRCSERK